MKISIIKKEKYNTSLWSGGKTDEILIYPKESSLKERNFLFRISSATIEIAEATFSDFTGFKRIITTLIDDIHLFHEEKDNLKEVHITPFKRDLFNGDIKTTSKGKCIDFNLIFKDNLKADLNFIKDEKINLFKNHKYLLFSLEDVKITITEDEINEKPHEKIILLQKGNSCFIEDGIGSIEINETSDKAKIILCEVKID